MNGKIIFVTGIGTGIGKTVVSAIIAEALQADYWKPVQSGLEEMTDTRRVQELISNKQTCFWKEAYSLQTPASPHLSALIDNVHISLDEILRSFEQQRNPERHVVIEGAGGVLVPLNDKAFFPDLMALLKAEIIVVSSQYLGNINHSLMTAEVLKYRGLPILGWIFNGTYHVNEEDIVKWSGLKKISHIGHEETVDKSMIKQYADKLKPSLMDALRLDAN